LAWRKNMQNYKDNLKFLVFLVFFLASMPFAKAQDSTRFSLSLKDKPFGFFANAIEKSSHYTFYFDTGELDTVKVNLEANGQSLRQILNQIFKNLSFHYAIDKDNQVFISHIQEIQVELPPGYFIGGIGNRQNIFIQEHESKEIPPKREIITAPENKLLFIGSSNPANRKSQFRLSGYIKDLESGEGILGATVRWDNQAHGIVADQYGYYTLNLPPGRHTLLINSAGMTETRRVIQLNNDGKLDIYLREFISTLKTVTVTAEKGVNVQSSQMGLNRLNFRQIKQVPVVFGEADVIKVILTLPGVTSVGEASNGYNVRGGATDQNLILFGDATIFNPSHLFGFFSAFNPEVVKGIELYKSAIPEKYGGRLSSVLDLSLQDGNKKEWTGDIGLGPVTGKLTLQGPLIKDKTSVILGLRTTYSDWVLKTIQSNAIRVNNADFNDGSIRITHSINEKNSLYLLGYFSNDRFRIGQDTLYQYGNLNGNVKWKHIFNDNMVTISTLGIDHYAYNVTTSLNPATAFKLGFSINQDYFRTDFTFSPNNTHKINFGLNSIFYQVRPGSLVPNSSSSLIKSNLIPQEQGLESAIYLGDEYSLSPKILVNIGLRLSAFNYLGPHTINDYKTGLPRDTTTITGIQNYGGGAFIKTYFNPEIRLSMRYTLSDNSSVKISYNTLTQYIHSISNTIAISPTDTWKLSDPYIKPQQGNQISLGFFRNFKENILESSVEVYYKTLHNYLDYKSGASLLLNAHLETDIINTQGKAYGIEFLLKKNAGKLNGWISYAYSRTFLKQEDSLAGETINKGAYYPASFDKPHNFNFIGNYRFTHRYSMSLNVIYSTGRPITLPLATFLLGGANSLLYSERNQYRVPDYFRTDLSFTLDGNHKIKQRFHSFWSFGVYNLTGRQNAYSNYFTQINGKIQGYQLSIFGTAIPFVTYNIHF